MEIKIKNKIAMQELAGKIANQAQKGDVIGLKGNLGAGKSFFASSFVNALTDQKTEVLSPTFNLVYSYKTNKGEVFHFDLYRIKNPNELENIGFFDALESGISLVEWPEIAQKYLPKNYLEITIKIGEGERRKIELKSTGEAWQKKLIDLE